MFNHGNTRSVLHGFSGVVVVVALNARPVHLPGSIPGVSQGFLPMYRLLHFKMPFYDPNSIPGAERLEKLVGVQEHAQPGRLRAAHDPDGGSAGRRLAEPLLGPGDLRGRRRKGELSIEGCRPNRRFAISEFRWNRRQTRDEGRTVSCRRSQTEAAVREVCCQTTRPAMSNRDRASAASSATSSPYSCGVFHVSLGYH